MNLKYVKFGNTINIKLTNSLYNVLPINGEGSKVAKNNLPIIFSFVKLYIQFFWDDKLSISEINWGWRRVWQGDNERTLSVQLIEIQWFFFEKKSLFLLKNTTWKFHLCSFSYAMLSCNYGKGLKLYFMIDKSKDGMKENFIIHPSNRNSSISSSSNSTANTLFYVWINILVIFYFNWLWV